MKIVTTSSGLPGEIQTGTGFSVLLAGGGVKGGTVHGATDEFGFRSEVDRVHVHDLHATLLSLLGMDHKKLTYFFQGRLPPRFVYPAPSPATNPATATPPPPGTPGPSPNSKPPSANSPSSA